MRHTTGFATKEAESAVYPTQLCSSGIAGPSRVGVFFMLHLHCLVVVGAACGGGPTTPTVLPLRRSPCGTVADEPGPYRREGPPRGTEPRIQGNKDLRRSYRVFGSGVLFSQTGTVNTRNCMMESAPQESRIEQGLVAPVPQASEPSPSLQRPCSAGHALRARCRPCVGSPAQLKEVERHALH